MENRILLVSTYSELTKMSQKIAEELNINLDIYEGGIMKNGHLYAQKNEDKYDVIISTGGTVEAIRKIVKKPVVSVDTGAIDLLSAVYKAKKYNNKIGMVAYKSDDLMELYKLKDYLDVDLEIFPYESKSELSKEVNDAVAFGKVTLVGLGDCIIETAKQHNLDYVVVHCREKHVRDVLINAVNICDLTRKDKERAERFKIIIDHSGEGIVSFDREKNITSFNSSAEKIMEIDSSSVINKNISNVRNDNFTQLYGDGSFQLSKLMKINNKQVVVNRIPVIVDNNILSIVVNFQETSKIQKIEQKLRVELNKKGLVAKYTFDDIIGESNEIKEAIERAKKIGKTNSTVLITAETGSGKELFAQSMHNVSSRRDGPFVAINCAALPENLLESELFGYEEGAFTGAKKGGKAGLFELAHGGTIFLDEISEIPIGLQGRLLRVLQEREILRIGSDYVTNVDIRVIAATNMNLYKKVKEGKFREDLFFRINVLDFYIPSLRERKDDIPMLFNFFLKSMNSTLRISDMKEGLIERFKSYYWPGNIRELENFAEKTAVLLGNNAKLDEKNIKSIFDKKMDEDNDKSEKTISDPNKILIDIGDLKDMENKIIREAVKNYKGDKSMLADKLGISRTTLWKKLKELEDEEENH